MLELPVKKKYMPLVPAILIFSVILLSGCRANNITSLASITDDNDRKYIWLDKDDIPEIKEISITNEAEGYRIVCTNDYENSGEHLLLIETGAKDIAFDLKLDKNNGQLFLKLKNPKSYNGDDNERVVTITLPPDIAIREFSNTTGSSSTDLRISGTDIRNIDIDTSSGSNYIELNDCTAGNININSNYGRTYAVMNQTSINGDILLTGKPDKSKVQYFDKVSGAVHAELLRSTINGSFRIDSATGKIEVYAENTVFSDTIETVSDSGMHFYDLWDCMIKTDTPVSAVSDSGKIYFKFAQHYANKGDFEVDLYSQSEEIYFRVWGALDLFRYDISTETKTGEKEFHSYEDFDTVEEGRHYQTKNFSEPLDLITVTAETGSGRIYTRVVDCYKKLRFCGDFKTMRPLDPPF